MNYHSQQHLYILLDTLIIKIGLAIPELQNMANLLCHFAKFCVCHLMAAHIAKNMCLCYSVDFAYTFRHQDF